MRLRSGSRPGSCPALRLVSGPVSSAVSWWHSSTPSSSTCSTSTNRTRGISRRMLRLAKRQPFSAADEPGRGLMMVEIDGLSYWHMQKAIEDGLMPTLQQMIENDGYVLSHVDCGLPSMTSACQAGIMFGDNHDIPAYRWYDKSQTEALRLGRRRHRVERPLCPWPGSHAPGFEHHEHVRWRRREVHYSPWPT